MSLASTVGSAAAYSFTPGIDTNSGSANATTPAATTPHRPETEIHQPTPIDQPTQPPLTHGMDVLLSGVGPGGVSSDAMVPPGVDSLGSLPIHLPLSEEARTFRRPPQIDVQEYSDQQRTPMTSPHRSRRGSHASAEGKGHQVRVCMFTMPQSCVLPLEMRPYASMYASPAGYPYYDPRQLQGGGVTSHYRTKPNPLLQYHSIGPTFPSSNINQTQTRGGSMGGGQNQQQTVFQHMKQQAEYGNYYNMMQVQQPQQSPVWTFPELSQRGGDPSRRMPYATMHYHQRRQRRSYDTSQSMPVSRMVTPSHAAAAAAAMTGQQQTFDMQTIGQHGQTGYQNRPSTAPAMPNPIPPLADTGGAQAQYIDDAGALREGATSPGAVG